MRSFNPASGIILIVLLSFCCQLSWAKHVLTYGGQFELSIPGDEDATKGWMDDAVIEIDEHIIITDLDVVIDIKHSNVFDLNILLQGPDGTEICLNSYKIKDFFEREDYVNTVFDDEAPVNVEDAEPPFAGKFKPKKGNLLSSFDGTDAFGQWKLRIEDLWLADSGCLEKFELKITVPEPASVSMLVFGGLLGMVCRKQKTPR